MYLLVVMFIFHGNTMEQIKALVNGNHNCVVLGGPGTGKTANLLKLYNVLINVHGGVHRVQCLAPTGLASLNLPDGKTIDHFFGFFDGRFTVEEVKDRMTTSKKQEISEIKVFIIDEISMLSAKKLDQVGELCIQNNTCH